MKTYNKAFLVLFILVFSIFLCGCAENTNDEGQLLRLHIRANSNSAADQEVKLKVRDSVIDYLNAQMSHISDLEQAKKEVDKHRDKIKAIADKVLSQNNMNYTASVTLNNEFFPTRMYESLVVESGYYDALIIQLGSGQGENWWCVIYPPLCYVEAQFGSGFRYKSKVQELIDKYFN